MNTTKNLPRLAAVIAVSLLALTGCTPESSTSESASRPAGETVTIRRISGKDEVRLHLAELGFVVGSEVTVVNEIAGNLIVQVKQSRLALDKTMASRIMVS